MSDDRSARLISTLGLYVLDYPAVVFSVLSFVRGFGWAKFVALLLLILGGGLWQWVVTCVLNLSTYFKLFHSYLLHFRHCSFSLRPLREYLPARLIEHLLRERLGISRTGYPLGHICVVRRRVVGERWPATMTTYPFETLPWFIMVTAEAADFGPHQRFMLLHEIGHTALFHQIATERRLHAAVQTLFFLIVVSICTSLDGTMALGVILAMLVWCVLTMSRRAPQVLFEQLADRFALHFLDRRDVDEMSRENLREYIPFDATLDSEARLASFEEAVRTRLRDERDAPWDEQQRAFNDAAVRHFWPPWYAYVFSAASVLTAALHVDYGSSWGTSIGQLSLASLLLPLLVAILVRNRVERFRQRVDRVMELGRVPPDIVPDFSARG